MLEADLLVHVIDVSHPHATEQMRAVFATLKEIGAAEPFLVNALNKIDRLRTAPRWRSLVRMWPEAWRSQP